MIKSKYSNEWKLNEKYKIDANLHLQSFRPQRVADLVHQQLATCLYKEVRDPRLRGLTLTAVEVTADLKHARIFYTLINSKERQQIQQTLDKARGYFRHLLSTETTLRFVPHLRFVYDESIERGDKLSTLINNALLQDQKFSD